MEIGASELASEFGVVHGGPSTATEAFETEGKVLEALRTNRLLLRVVHRPGLTQGSP
jgi:hypothetical protein